MTFPRVPFTPAESHVDWAGHQRHIDDRRAAVERAALPTARRIALGASHGLLPASAQSQIASPFETSLEATVRYGFREARREITSLRSVHPVVTAYEIPDAGQQAHAAVEGIEGALKLARKRAAQAAALVVSAIHTAAAGIDPAETAANTAAILSAATRAVHRVTLELVGESLNLGRTTGALSFPKPPEFALRSEQLDKNTCPRCDELHGLIVQLGSPEYYANTPPAGCFGGGRCRGIWVLGDTAQDVTREIAA